MKTLKATLFVALALFAASTWAAGCDLTLTMKVAHAEGPVSDSTIVYHALPTWAVTEVNKRGMSIIDVASKVGEQKNGDHSVTFGSSSVCDGVVSKTPEIMVEKVTLAGLAKILRQSAKTGESLIQDGEKQHAKGKKRAWHHADRKE